ncbi:MAG: DUF166 family protein [Nitrososphaerales archaeon]
MKIFALIQGLYGERIVENIKLFKPKSWSLKVYRFPLNLPTLLDEYEEIIPNPLNHYDLILSLGENPNIAYLLPTLTKLTKAKAVIAPTDNSEWLPAGIREVLAKELSKMGVAFSFPKPFCSLTPKSGNSLIDEFAEYFGKPKFKLLVEDGVIKGLEVIRGAPCGCSYFVAEKLLGIKVRDAPIKASLLAQIYPCLASRFRDSEYGESLIHIAAEIAKDALKN